ncbi:hypothetical protein ACWCSH_21585, partial [Streptosporangium sp. NPDC001682]
MGGLVDLGRRGVLLLGAVAVLAACASTAQGADDERVRTDLEPLHHAQRDQQHLNRENLTHRDQPPFPFDSMSAR